MTERGSDAVERDATRFVVGPSAIGWRDGRLVIAIDEVAVPWPRRVRGTVTIDPGPRPDHRLVLDADGRHRWSLIAPSARATVRFTQPSFEWTGSAYVDSNRGDRALEDDFVRWDWSRAHRTDGTTAIVYDVVRRDGSTCSIAEEVDRDGRVESFIAPPTTALPRTAWGLARGTRADDATPARIRMPLEDGPFYARAIVDATWGGTPVVAVHEHLSLDRFARRWVRALLPFRMPRRATGPRAGHRSRASGP